MRNRPFRIQTRDVPLLETIVAASQKRKNVPEGEAVAALSLLLTRKLAEQLQNTSRPEDFSEGPPTEHPLLTKLFACVRHNFDRPPNSKALAEMLEISEGHLRRLVRKYFNGIPLGRFLYTLRLGHASELLSGTELTIADIALRCGYADAFSFSRAFKANAGQSPSQYRNHFQKSRRK